MPSLLRLLLESVILLLLDVAVEEEDEEEVEGSLLLEGEGARRKRCIERIDIRLDPDPEAPEVEVNESSIIVVDDEVAWVCWVSTVGVSVSVGVSEGGDGWDVFKSNDVDEDKDGDRVASSTGKCDGGKGDDEDDDDRSDNGMAAVVDEGG